MCLALRSVKSNNVDFLNQIRYFSINNNINDNNNKNNNNDNNNNNNYDN
jgi:hypothetical protein